MARKVTVEIVGDDSSLRRAFRSADRSANRFGRSFSTIAKGAGIAGLGIGAAVAVGLKKSIDSANEHAVALAQTRAALKSTGGAAGVTANDITKLSDAIEKKSGMDDLAIQSGENLLLTFTNLRNRAGEGNDIFNQTTKIMADMSQALGQDTKSSAIQLGKALNDPIKGVTALRRVGVSFTKAQQDQIKALVDSGKSLDAQKLILRELNKEFGGSAEAFGKTLPGQIQIFKARIDDAAQAVGEALVPALTKGLDALSDILPVVQEFAGDLIERLRPALVSIGAFINNTLVPLFVDDLIPIFERRVLPVIEALGTVFRQAIQQIGDVINDNREELLAIWDRVAKAIQLLSKVAIPIIRLIFVTILPPALRITIKALDLVTAALEGIIGMFGRVLSAGRTFGKALAAVIKAPINAAISAINTLKIPSFRADPLGKFGPTITFPGIDPIPNIPKLAAGGIVTRPTLAVVGERGPEAVIPLNRRNVQPVQIVNIQLDGRTIARTILPHLQKESGLRSTSTRGTNAGSALGFA